MADDRADIRNRRDELKIVELKRRARIAWASPPVGVWSRGLTPSSNYTSPLPVETRFIGRTANHDREAGAVILKDYQQRALETVRRFLEELVAWSEKDAAARA